MRVVLHIGPHKTGTTSIQAHLLSVFGADVPSRVWYPRAAKWGPGHAELAWQLTGLNSYHATDRDLSYILSHAHEFGVDTLILSSEEFSRAIPDRIYLLEEAFAGCN